MAERDDQHRAAAGVGRAETTPPEPDQGLRTRAAKVARERQLAAEMRANLKKRKAQARARQSLDRDPGS